VKKYIVLQYKDHGVDRPWCAEFFIQDRGWKRLGSIARVLECTIDGIVFGR
jgi:hypothetical protein